MVNTCRLLLNMQAIIDLSFMAVNVQWNIVTLSHRWYEIDGLSLNITMYNYVSLFMACRYHSTKAAAKPEVVHGFQQGKLCVYRI